MNFWYNIQTFISKAIHQLYSLKNVKYLWNDKSTLHTKEEIVDWVIITKLFQCSNNGGPEHGDNFWTNCRKLRLLEINDKLESILLNTMTTGWFPWKPMPLSPFAPYPDLPTKFGAGRAINDREEEGQTYVKLKL